MFVGVLSIKAYAEWGLQHPELNNTRYIWVGSWQNPFFIVYFYNECYIEGWGIGMGKESVAILTQPDQLNRPTCTKDDLARIQSYNINEDNPYNGSGICTFEFENAQVISSDKRHGGIEGVYDTKLTMTTTFETPFKCFLKSSETTCEWVYGTTERTDYCDIPSELDKERFWGLANYFTSVNNGVEG